MRASGWRTPMVVLVCGGIVLTISLGVWLAGHLFDATGSYNLMWVLTIGMSVVAALVNLPINDRQIERTAASPA